MANGRSNTPFIVLGVVIVGVLLALVFGGQFSAFDIADRGGIPQPIQDAIPAGTQEFSGQLIVNVIHRDALDNAEERIEGTNLVTTYYKSADEITFSTIGSGSGNQITITTDMNSIMYASETVPAGQDFFVAPQSTADQNLNPRIIDFFFRDINFDGIREWVFKFDLRDMAPPRAGQVASTMSFFVNSYDVGTFTINSPANITAVGTGSGTVNFIRWEITQPQETASAQFEYEIRINNIADQKWDRSLSTLDMPNIGIKSLSEFDEQLTSSEVIYRFKVGAGTAQFDSANYVAVRQNGNEVIPTPLRFVTNLAGSDDLAVTFNIKSLSASGGTNPTVTDTVNVQES